MTRIGKLWGGGEEGVRMFCVFSVSHKSAGCVALGVGCTDIETAACCAQ